MNSRFLVLLICALSFFPVFGDPPKNYVTSHPLDGSVDMDAKTFVQMVGKAEPPRIKPPPRKSIFTRVLEKINNSIDSILSTSPRSYTSNTQGMRDKSSMSAMVRMIEKTIQQNNFNSRPIALNQLVDEVATPVRNAILKTDLLQRLIVRGNIIEAHILTKALKEGDHVKFSIPMLVSQSEKPYAHVEFEETGELIPIREAEFYDHNSKEKYPGAIFLKADSILLALAKGIFEARYGDYRIVRGKLHPTILPSCFALMKLASAEEFNTEYYQMAGPNSGYHLPITELLLDSVEQKLKRDFQAKIAEISTKAQKRDGRLDTIVP